MTGSTVVTGSRGITNADVVRFAELTGDFTALHTDDEHARAAGFDRAIVHGALVFSLSIGLMTETHLLNGTIIAFSRVDHLRFTRPVLIGDTIHVSKRVLACEPKTPESGIVSFDTRVVNQEGQTVLAYVDRLVVRRRGQGLSAVESTAAVAIDAASRK